MALRIYYDERKARMKKAEWKKKRRRKRNAPSLNKSLKSDGSERKINERGVSFDSIRRINARQKRSSTYRLLMTQGGSPM